MPLRSVEAASRDDAIAAAREQFGPSARVVGVRRVRSGGVLGFFATERYVAEVAADPNARSAAPAASDDSTPTAAETTGGFASSPLSAASPATAASGTSGRAPARNGAAAYARTAATAPRPPAQEEDAVSELAGLFADAPADQPVNLYGPGTRTAASPASRGPRDSVLPQVEESRLPAGRIGLAAALDPAAFTPDAPSPFTAALARMAAGDRDVRDAVAVALDQPRVVRGRSTVGSWPSRSASIRSQDSSAPSATTRQEEEPVGDQVVAPPSTAAPYARELPNWAAEPTPPIGSPREEAIAEALRSALAQGHSDEALAGILRKMLAGASPETALAEPMAGSLFQDAPAAAAPAPAPAPEAAPMTMSLAMALASAGSTVAAAETTAPEPAAEVPADVEPSMFGAMDDGTPVAVPAPVEPALDVTPEFDTDSADDADDTEAAAEFDAPVHETTYEDSVFEPTYEAPAYEAPAHEAPAYEAPVYEPSSYRVPSYRSPAYESPLFDSPLFNRPTSDNTSMWGPSVASIWGEPTSEHVPLWGEPAPFSGTACQADLPIWDDIVSGVRAESAESEPSVEGAEAREAADELAISDEAIAGDELSQSELPAVEAVVEDAPAVEGAIETSAMETPAVEDDVLESEVAVLAPVFARTASDPAPLALDATSVLPPLSLLPPLPGSRAGRGRPPVPPALPRSSSRTADVPAARTSLTESAPVASGPADDRPAEEASSAEVPAPAAPETTPEIEAVSAEAALPVETASMRAIEKRAARPTGPSLATVTRLPVVTRAEDDELPEIDLFEELDTPSTAATASTEPAPQPEAPTDVDAVAELAALGLPAAVLGEDFARDVAATGTYAALTRALSLRLPAVPEVPTGAGEVLFVVGPGVEALRAARTLAASLRLDPESVQWATRGDLAGLAPRESRMTTADSARQRRQATAEAGTVTIVAVDVPLRTDASWMEQLLAIWTPVSVWAVVEATRKPEDLDPWLARLATVDALIVTDTDLSGEPAAALRRADTPVAVVDGGRATAHRWASLLCERLETRRA